MVERTSRSEVPVEQTWDLDGLYPDSAAWEADFRRVAELLPTAVAYQGRLGAGPGQLLACIEQLESLEMLVERLIWYASNKLSEDQADPGRQTLSDRAMATEARVAAATAFFSPEVLALPGGTVEAYIEAEPALQIYRQMLRELLDRKEHMLSAEGEAIVAAMHEVAAAPYEIWQNATTADMKFEPVKGEQGNLVPMSLSMLQRLMQSPDRGVRQASYESALRAYDGLKRTLTASFAAAVKRDVILARLRHYPSALAGALHEVQLPEALFHNLIAAAEEGSGHFRRYWEIRRRAMGLEQLMPWDMQAPIDVGLGGDISLDEAWQMVREAMAPLGMDYVAVLDRARQERWVDWADNEGKSYGAYSASLFGHHPVILMNWQGKVSDAFTLAHELGHAAHATFSHRRQPYAYSDCPLFLAEIASTTNEILLSRHLLATATDPKLKRYVLTRALTAFTSNFYWGSMMAAFQLQVHEMVERGEPLTYESVTGAQTAIMRRFYGDSVQVTEEGMGATWMRPPHHFFNFYSYQYATGISAAAAFAVDILHGGQAGVERYRTFLGAGSSAYPLEILKSAGLDMTTKQPMEQAVAVFADLVDELEQSLA